MKRQLILIMVLATTLLTGPAMAGTVDIGMGHMDRSDFEHLQRIVSGQAPFSTSLTRHDHPNRIGEFNQGDLAGIRRPMVHSQSASHLATADTPLIDVGLGDISTEEFCDLNKLVASNGNTQLAMLCR